MDGCVNDENRQSGDGRGAGGAVDAKAGILHSQFYFLLSKMQDARHCGGAMPGMKC